MSEIETRLLIGGERSAGDGDRLAVENPFTEETVATVATPSAEQLDAAVAAAAEAQRRLGAHPRGRARRAAARGRRRGCAIAAMSSPS